MSAIQSYRNQPSTQDEPIDESGPICICCDTQMSGSDLHCPSCQMPAAVTLSAGDSDCSPSFVSVLGASNAGKTVYLGLLLDLLSSQASSLTGAAKGTFSITLQEQVITALQQRQFPAKTPTESDAWNWLHCELSDGRSRKAKKLEFVAPDFAGEAIAAELDQTGTHPAIRHIISQSGGFLILCDSEQVRDAGAREDLFAMKIGSYISQLQSGNGRARRGPTKSAVAIVFTKSDTSPEAEEDAATFAANNMPRFVDYCQRNFPTHKFFASSVVGSSCFVGNEFSGTQQVPLHIEPRGVVEPLQWIVTQC